MSDGKRYYWLRLHDDFFSSIRIKKLRKMAGGDTYVIIYLKMQLKAMKTDGCLSYKGYEQDFVDELALDLDEEPDNVRITLAYLLSCGLAETDNNVNFFLPYAVDNTGSETSAAERMRKMRERNNVTPMLQDRYGEKEIEIDTRDIDRDRDKRGSGGKTKFSPPTLEDVKVYCSERKNHVDAQRFLDYYTSNGWKVGRNQMKDWKAAVRTWEREDKQRPKNKTPYDDLRTETTGDDADKLARRFGIG